jgi:hypothetical protein
MLIASTAAANFRAIRPHAPRIREADAVRRLAFSDQPPLLDRIGRIGRLPLHRPAIGQALQLGAQYGPVDQSLYAWAYE